MADAETKERELERRVHTIEDIVRFSSGLPKNQESAFSDMLKHFDVKQ